MNKTMYKHRRKEDACCRRLPGRTAVRLVLLLLSLLIPVIPAMAAEEEPDVRTIVYRYILDEMDLSPAAACGIMGNMEAESRFTPSISGYNGYGLCQWTGVRASRLRAFCETNKLDMASAEGQVAFIHYELQNYYPQVYAYLQAVTNDAAGAYNAAHFFCLHFEIPVNAGAMAAYRGGLARDMFWPAYGETLLYLKAAPGKGGIVLTWTGQTSEKQVVVRARDRTGPFEKVGTVGKRARTFTDKKVKKNKKYYYYVCPESVWKKYVRKQQDPPVRSNMYMVVAGRTVEDDACIVTISKKGLTYNGKAKKPKVRITYSRKRLKEGKDYRLSWKNNVNAGRATLLITGIGEYTGTARRYFTISKGKLRAKAANVTVKQSVGSVKPKITAVGVKNPLYRLLSVSDRRVAVIRDNRLVPLKTGTTTVTIRIYGGKNYGNAVKKFRLTVTRGSAKEK